jgi:hypothetical protein
VPAQIGLADAVMLTLTGKVGFNEVIVPEVDAVQPKLSVTVTV